jgi:hypothetical protein
VACGLQQLVISTETMRDLEEVAADRLASSFGSARASQLACDETGKNKTVGQGRYEQRQFLSRR